MRLLLHRLDIFTHAASYHVTSFGNTYYEQIELLYLSYQWYNLDDKRYRKMSFDLDEYETTQLNRRLAAWHGMKRS